MDFKELEYFSTIAKCGNLTHAARQLYVSQPTLSKFLQKLEEDLDWFCSNAGAAGWS